MKLLTYPGRISILRTLVHGFMSGKNSLELDKEGFLSGCTKFGLNNPLACVTRRLAHYGNTSDVLKELERVATDAQIDIASFGHVEETRILTASMTTRLEKQKTASY
jgi:hypothetical protein